MSLFIKGRMKIPECENAFVYSLVYSSGVVLAAGAARCDSVPGRMAFAASVKAAGNSGRGSIVTYESVDFSSCAAPRRWLSEITVTGTYCIH